MHTRIILMNLFISSIYRVWPHFLIQNPQWHHHIDYKSVCVCLIVQLKMKSHFLTRLTFLSKLWQLTFQVCLCMKVSLSFFVLNIRRLSNSFLSLPLSFSLSFSLWVILSIFPSSCSVTTWHGFDFYTRAAQTPTAECVCVCAKPLPDP